MLLAACENPADCEKIALSVRGQHAPRAKKSNERRRIRLHCKAEREVSKPPSDERNTTVSLPGGIDEPSA
jgi:hypothetical protein